MGYYTHYFAFQELEFIGVDGQKTYFLNRERKQLENIYDSEDVLEMVQEQHGRTSSGRSEILQRFIKIDPESDEEIGESVLFDSSPETLEMIWKE